MAHSETSENAQLHQLISDAKAGHSCAFEELFRRYEKYVFKTAFARLKNFHDAEDVTQHVFLEAYLHLHRLEDPAKFAAWLRRLANNHCADRLRRKSVVTSSADSLSACVAEAAGERDCPHEFAEIEFHSLSHTLRETMELHYLQNYPLKEISARLGVPLGTIKRRLHEARLRLREKSSADPNGLKRG